MAHATTLSFGSLARFLMMPAAFIRVIIFVARSNSPGVGRFPAAAAISASNLRGRPRPRPGTVARLRTRVFSKFASRAFSFRRRRSAIVSCSRAAATCSAAALARRRDFH